MAVWRIVTFPVLDQLLNDEERRAALNRWDRRFCLSTLPSRLSNKAQFGWYVGIQTEKLIEHYVLPGPVGNVELAWKSLHPLLVLYTSSVKLILHPSFFTPHPSPTPFSPTRNPIFLQHSAIAVKSFALEKATLPNSPVRPFRRPKITLNVQSKPSPDGRACY